MTPSREQFRCREPEAGSSLGVVSKPVKPTKAMYAAIGRVAGESAEVDARLRKIFCYLMDSPYGAIVAAGEDSSNLVKMCLRAIRYNHALSDAQVEHLTAIFKAIEALRPLRNYLVHAQWEKGSQPGVHHGIRSSRVSPSLRQGTQGTSEWKVWTTTGATEVADNLALVARYLDQFMENAFDRPPFAPLMERWSWDKFNEMFGSLLSPREGAERGGDAVNGSTHGL